MNNPIYLDYAAATPLDDEVLEAMMPYFAEKFYNPSATYLPAVTVRKELEAARAAVAQQLGAKPADITFTAGGTEANNLAIRGVMQQFPEANVVVSSIEHESVLAPAHLFSVREAAVTPQGIVDLITLEKQIDDQTVLVSIMCANNEVGTIQPLRKIAQLLQNIRAKRQAAGSSLPLYFHTDAAQAANYLDLHVARLGVDLLTLNAGKMYGPKQSGVLYAASHVRLQPQMSGGGQERGVRSGTENVAGAIGFAASLRKTAQRRETEVQRLQKLQQQFFDQLEEKVPGVIINGSKKVRLPNNIHITIPGIDNERVLLELEQAGILAAAGSACSASNEEPSHVLNAMGISDTDAQSSLRFTTGRLTDEAAVTKTVEALATLTNKGASNG